MKYKKIKIKQNKVKRKKKKKIIQIQTIKRPFSLLKLKVKIN